MTDHVAGLASRFIRTHSLEASRVLERQPSDELSAFLAQLPPDVAAILLESMDVGTAARNLERMEPARAAAALSLVPTGRALVLVRATTEATRELLLDESPPDRKKYLERLLAFPEHTVGALMNPRLLTLVPELAVAEAIAQVRTCPARASRYLYVVDRPGNLTGVVSLKQLLAGRDDAPVVEIMTGNVVFLRTGDSLASVAVHPAWLAYRMLPVLDDAGLFAGVLLRAPRSEADGTGLRGNPSDQAAFALGELYGIGLSALMNGAVGGTLAQPPTDEAAHRTSDDDTSDERWR